MQIKYKGIYIFGDLEKREYYIEKLSFNSLIDAKTYIDIIKYEENE